MERIFIESFEVEKHASTRLSERVWVVRVEDENEAWIRNYFRNNWSYNRSDTDFNPSVMNRDGKCSRLVRKKWCHILEKWLTVEVIAASWDKRDRLEMHIN